MGSELVDIYAKGSFGNGNAHIASAHKEPVLVLVFLMMDVLARAATGCHVSCFSAMGYH